MLQLVSHTGDRRTASVARVPLDADGDAQIDGDALRQMLAPGATTVGAIVTHVDPDDGPLVCGPEVPGTSCQMRYTLTVNGVNQRQAG